MNKKAVEIERDQDYNHLMSQTIFNINKYSNIKEKTLTKLYEHDG